MASPRPSVGTLRAAFVAVALGCLLSACHRPSDDDDDPTSGDDPRDPRAGSVSRGGRGNKAGRSGSASSCDWIPSDATETTRVASLRADQSTEPMCDTEASALDVPKSVAMAIDRELRESTRMSDEDEARIGARMEAALPRERSFRGKLDLPQDVQRYRGYLSDIVKNLASKSARPNMRYRIHTVRSPVFNAAALPGGVILVFTGTLEGREAVRSEAELAGVLGHEISHVEKRHVVAAYQYARAALGNDSDEAVLAMRVISQPLSTEHELEADDRGLELMTLAGYDPQAVVDLWKRKAKSEPRSHRRRRGSDDVISEVMEGVGELLRSHPPSTVRACHAMAKQGWVREHAPCDRLYDGRTNVSTHVAGPRHPY